MTLRAAALLGLRLLGLVAFILVAIQFGEWIKTVLDMQILPHNEARAFRLLMLSLLIYTLVLAIPFVPGAEIGITLMAIFGASAAPLVYLATVVGLMLAYAIGALIPPAATCRILRRIGLKRAASLVAAAHTARRDGNPTAFLDTMQHPLLTRLAKYRHLTLAALINLPGNAIIGGGGGLSLMAGLSGTFSTAGFLLTVACAVLPVPFAVYVFGLNI